MLVLGIDEAGYGPLLGPLVVGGTAFRLADAGDSAEFAPRLRCALAHAPAVVVGDSKRVFRGDRDLAALERAVLGFLAAPGGGVCAPPDLDGLLRGVGADPTRRRDVPWYAGEPPTFPLRLAPEDVAADGARLAAGLDAAGVEFLAFAAGVVTEHGLNEAVARLGNKADALFETASAVLARLLALRRRGEPVAALLDRHGGRRHYLPLLRPLWPGTYVWALAEEERSSSYRLTLDGGGVDLEFRVEADREAPQVSLASMLAKYLREVHMALFNAWFARLCPDVPPTAGYREDGARWLRATRDARGAAGIPDSVLVRVR